MFHYSLDLLPLLGLVLFFGLFVPTLFKWFHLPFATSLIWTGFILGPQMLNWVSSNDSLRLLGFIGAHFLMLLAGFESSRYTQWILQKKGLHLLFFSGFLPALVGFSISHFFAYNWTTSFFVGTLFLTSSLLITFSTLEKTSNLSTHFVELIKPLVSYLDLFGSLMAFVIFKSIEPHHRFSLPILLGLLVTFVILLRLFLPDLIHYFLHKFSSPSEPEAPLRLVISVLLMVLFIFSFLDVPSIIAAYLVGYSLSQVPKIDDIREKLKTIGHGFFIPIFLFLVGLDLDFSFLKSFSHPPAAFLVLVFGALLSKILFGYWGAQLVGLDQRPSWIYSLLTSTRLTVALSISYTAYQAKIIDEIIYSSFITITAISTFLLPPLVMWIHKGVKATS